MGRVRRPVTRWPVVGRPARHFAWRYLTFDGSRLDDRWSFLFFGYTNCPAVCPMTLGSFSDVQKLIDGQETRLELGQFRDFAV